MIMKDKDHTEIFIEKYLDPEWRPFARELMTTEEEWVHCPHGFIEAIILAARKAAFAEKQFLDIRKTNKES